MLLHLIDDIMINKMFKQTRIVSYDLLFSCFWLYLKGIMINALQKFDLL